MSSHYINLNKDKYKKNIVHVALRSGYINDCPRVLSQENYNIWQFRCTPFSTKHSPKLLDCVQNKVLIQQIESYNKK